MRTKGCGQNRCRQRNGNRRNTPPKQFAFRLSPGFGKYKADQSPTNPIHAKKNASRKPSKAQTENEGYKEEILDFLNEGGSYTIGELIKAVPSLNEFSTSKVSALVRQLKEDNLVVRTEVKGKAYFAKA